MKTRHPTPLELPGLADGPETIEVGGPDLARVCDDLQAQGKFVFRMDIVGLSSYRLLVQPLPRKEPR